MHLRDCKIRTESCYLKKCDWVKITWWVAHICTNDVIITVSHSIITIRGACFLILSWSVIFLFEFSGIVNSVGIQAGSPGRYEWRPARAPSRCCFFTGTGNHHWYVTSVNFYNLLGHQMRSSFSLLANWQNFWVFLFCLIRWYSIQPRHEHSIKVYPRNW